MEAVHEFMMWMGKRDAEFSPIFTKLDHIII
jgi:hypothetical protein